MSGNDSSNKSSVRKSKKGVVTDLAKLQNENDLSSHSHDHSLENQLRIENDYLKLQLEHGFRIIDNMKENIASYEEIIQNLKLKEHKIIFPISENSDFAKLIQINSANKKPKGNCTTENVETQFMYDERIPLNTDHKSKILRLQGVIKKHKYRINFLKMKLVIKSGYVPDSSTETDESTEHSVCNPKTNFTDGKRGRPKKRPTQKYIKLNESESSSTENINLKRKSVGQPKSPLPNYLVLGGPVEKKPRGRPRLTASDNELTSLDNSAIKADNDGSIESSESGNKENIDNMEMRPERERSPKKLPFNEDVAASGDVKKGRGRPKKSDVNGKRGRGRPRVASKEKSVEEQKSTGNQSDSLRRSRGRPRKERHAESNISSNS